MRAAVLVPCNKAQATRKLLELHGLWDKTRKLQRCEGLQGDKVAIPVNTADTECLSLLLNNKDGGIHVTELDLPPSKKELHTTPAEHLKQAVSHLLEEGDVSPPDKAALLGEVPDHWEKHGDLVLLPASAFISPAWSAFGKELWLTVADCLSGRRVARQAVVRTDGFRTPQVMLLLGEDGLVQQVDNGIRYEYDVTRCMFSAGNITEKLRVAGFNCQGETVVDLYAGIGYFTLPYLVHAGAKHVHACEWNWDAVAALQQNLRLNGVDHRCTVHPGDNRLLSLTGVADRVNLGLIPSSLEGWPVACRVLKPTGGFLHVHGNVNSRSGVGETLQSGVEGMPETFHGQINPNVHAATGPANNAGGCLRARVNPLVHAGAGTVYSANACMHKGFEGDVCKNLHEIDVRHCRQCVKNTSTEMSQSAHLDRTIPLMHAAIITVKSTSGSMHEGVRLETTQCDRESMMEPGGHRETSPVDKPEFTPCSGGEASHPQQKVGCDSNQLSTCTVHSNCSSGMDGVCTKLNTADNICSGSGDLLCHLVASVTCSALDACEELPSPTASKASLPSRSWAWELWGRHVCKTLQGFLEKEHGGTWQSVVIHTEHVKSYAPHVDHIVLDVHCHPTSPV